MNELEYKKIKNLQNRGLIRMERRGCGGHPTVFSHHGKEIPANRLHLHFCEWTRNPK
jgi:hypothetical protein